MAVYLFRVIFEDYNDVSRDIEIKATQTFEHLHKAINESIGFDSKADATFYMADEHWKKGQGFTSSLTEKVEGKLLPMKNSRLTNYINDPHQKIYYVIESSPTWEFFVELFKILKDDEKATYPRVAKSVGIAPKQYGATVLGEEKKDLDFLADAKYLEEEEFAGDVEDAGPEGEPGPEGDLEAIPEELENADDAPMDEDSSFDLEKE